MKAELLFTLLLTISLAIPTTVFGKLVLQKPIFIELLPRNGTFVIKNCQGQEDGCKNEYLCPPEFCRLDGAMTVWQLPLYKSPDIKSQLKAKIQITTNGVSDYRGEYINEEGLNKKLEPDSVPGINPESLPFQFTVTAVSGDWIKLPKRPFEYEVWINPKHDWKLPNDLPVLLVQIEIGSIYKTLHLGDVIFTKITQDDAFFRQKNENDALCDGEDRKKIDKSRLKISSVPIKDLYDSDGHLRIVRNNRNCD